MCNSWTIRVVEDNKFFSIFSVIYLVYVIVCMFLTLLLQQIDIRAKKKSHGMYPSKVFNLTKTITIIKVNIKIKDCLVPKMYERV